MSDLPIGDDLSAEFDPEDPNAEAPQQEEVLPPLPQTTIQLDSLEAEKAVADGDVEPFIEHRDKTWHTVAELPGAVNLSLARLQDPKLPDAQKASIIYNVISYAVVETERAEFDTWLMDASPIINMEELMVILQKLVEKVLNRPTT